MDLDPIRFLLLTAAGWLNREQASALAYLRAENAYLRQQLGPRVPRFSDPQRASLARAAHHLNRSRLRELGTLVRPDTLRRWYRELVARKYDGSTNRRRGPGSRQPDLLLELVLRLANEDPNATPRLIANKLRNLGFEISKSTIHRILRKHGIEPTPERGMRWTTFLCAHWGHICAADFVHVEVLTVHGLVRYQVLVLIDLATRVATIGGVVRQAHGEWTANTFRELTNPFDGFLRGKTKLILDRDPVFTKDALAVLTAAGVDPVVLPGSSPNLNAYVERFIGSIRRELLAHVIPISEKHLRWLLREYFEYYNHERPHQALGGVPPDPRGAANAIGPIRCRKRIGGLLRHYYREAA